MQIFNKNFMFLKLCPIDFQNNASLVDSLFFAIIKNTGLTCKDMQLLT